MRNRVKISILVASILASGGVNAALIDLTGIGYIQYGDALSYSMPFANLQAIGDPTPQPGDPFYIESSPGQIANLVVPATGVNGGPVTLNDVGMDHAFETPSGVSGENFFQTGGLSFGGNTYPGGDPGQVMPFFGDQADTWDATLASLKSFLSGDQLVFFFNNNQLNQNAAEQSLAVWAQAWITDDAGNVVDPDGAGAESGFYELTNDGGLYALASEGGGGTILGNPTTFTSPGRRDPGAAAIPNTDNFNTDYVLSGGELCADSFGVLVSCADPTALVGPVNHNLGANSAAYAVVVPELNALMDGLFANLSLDLNMYTLHIDLRMGCDPRLFGADRDAAACAGAIDPNTGSPSPWGKNLNNGFEQVFIGTLARSTSVPEPASLALLGIGLAGLGVFRRRKTSI